MPRWLQELLVRFGVPRARLDDRYDVNQIQAFEAALHKCGTSFKSFSSILEFGVGWGRLASHVMRFAPQAAFYGVEVDDAYLAKARKNLPAGKFSLNDTKPPLNFPEASFDFIYTYSVFTHLTEANHQAWLKELARVLKPGGVMLHTIHSYAAVERMAFFSPTHLDKYALPEPAERFIAAQRDYHYNVDNPARPEYGVTLMRRGYAEKNWPEYSGLKLLGYFEAAIESYPEGCHDLVILGRPR